MLFLAFALYWEAAPWIRTLSAKRLPEFTKDQVFFSEAEPEPAFLIVTGSGPVPSAAALSRVLARLAPKEGDLFANIGSCGCPDGSVPIGQTVLIHRLLEAAADRSFYPDMLYVHSFPERSLTTQAIPRREAGDSAGMLYDMEAAALFQAALPFFSTERMFFFKTVSDYGAVSELSPTALLSEGQEALPAIRDTLLRFAANRQRGAVYGPEEEARIEEFCRLLCASESMRLEIRRLITYYELERGYAIAMLQDFIERHGLRSADGGRPLSRKEGKLYLERFREACLQ